MMTLNIFHVIIVLSIFIFLTRNEKIKIKEHLRVSYKSKNSNYQGFFKFGIGMFGNSFILDNNNYGKYDFDFQMGDSIVSVKIELDGYIRGTTYCNTTNCNDFYSLQYDEPNECIFITIDGTKWYIAYNKKRLGTHTLKFTNDITKAIKFTKVTG